MYESCEQITLHFYPTDLSEVFYFQLCAGGFLSGAGSTAQTVGATSLTTGSQELAEEESQTTKETPQFWDIKWNF